MYNSACPLNCAYILYSYVSVDGVGPDRFDITVYVYVVEAFKQTMIN